MFDCPCRSHGPVFLWTSAFAPAFRRVRPGTLTPRVRAMPKRETQHGQVPSLSPRFGGADKKPRFLDKEAMSIGRARGCDIALDANEVSAVHCLFYRSAAGGFRIRDCGSRTGTRLNGAAVKNAPLADGDMLQIGPFSFEVKVPPEALAQAAEPAIDLRRWERVAHSRRRLARLALSLRRKLREGRNSDRGLTEEPVDLTVVNGRSQQLQQSEAELAQARAEIEQEREAHRQRVQHV